MKILIIGCGYLGLATGIALRQAGHTITATSRSPSKLPFLEKELGHALLWDKTPTVFENQEIVIFTAAPDSPTLYTETYLENAKTIVSVPNLKQIIYSSSNSVYGDHQGAEVTEETPPFPLNAQGQILLETEKVLLSRSESCIFRLGELFGPGRTIEMRLQNSQGKLFPGSGNSICNLSPLPEVVRAIRFAIEKPLFGLYNLCIDSHPTRKELYAEICAAQGLPPIQWDSTKTSLHAGNKLVNCDKIKKSGFNFSHPQSTCRSPPLS